ncbi:erythromycin esterase family protein [Christiangramia sp.]|uniref:erythromycin esterase family protein n=1 Tax=Christiangramia sp. TaxID=1931228 RepID=UPI002602763A|nr:erythromycin esterase family protein [Christiangramia sp.]
MQHKNKILLLLLLISKLSFAQIENNLYELDSINDLLTSEVQLIISNNIEDKRVVFLGESGHHIGSDFLAKSQFVKYLVDEKGYKDIVFESDFFGLYFDHEKYNIFPHWSLSVQCQELYKFLEENNVTIWGLDNQTHSYYTYHNFLEKLTNFMNENALEFKKEFMVLVDKILKNGSSAKREIKNNEAEFLIAELDEYLLNEKVKSNALWHQILESFKSTVQIYTINSNKKDGIPIRDKQMAENLDFLVNKFLDKKFIVWVANSHMAKYEYDFMKGKTMGSQFVEMNPGTSYHIAVSSIQMPYRTKRSIEKYINDKDNLLHFLPSIDMNYFIDSKQLIYDNPNFENKQFEGLFNLDKSKTNWFKHFDALVFIGKGERTETMK